MKNMNAPLADVTKVYVENDGNLLYVKNEKCTSFNILFNGYFGY